MSHTKSSSQITLHAQNARSTGVTSTATVYGDQSYLTVCTCLRCVWHRLPLNPSSQPPWKAIWEPAMSTLHYTILKTTEFENATWRWKAWKGHGQKARKVGSNYVGCWWIQQKRVQCMAILSGICVLFSTYRLLEQTSFSYLVEWPQGREQTVT